MTTSYDTVYETSANVAISNYNYQNHNYQIAGHKGIGERSITIEIIVSSSSFAILLCPNLLRITFFLLRLVSV